MRLAECELCETEIRGKRLVIIYGDRAITDAEGSALLTEFGASRRGTPVYASPNGWQTLDLAGGVVMITKPDVSPPPAESASKSADADVNPATRKTRAKR